MSHVEGKSSTLDDDSVVVSVVADIRCGVVSTAVTLSVSTENVQVETLWETPETVLDESVFGDFLTSLVDELFFTQGRSDLATAFFFPMSDGNRCWLMVVQIR